jgi:hypothetical protein
LDILNDNDKKSGVTGGFQMNEKNNEIIATIAYSRIERFVEWHEQKYIKSIHSITVYADKVSTSTNTFGIENVYDISYKPFSGSKGLLYLHTNQGVFTYEIENDPSNFIHAFKKLAK